MLTQQEADTLIEILKDFNEEESPFSFPCPGDYKKINLVSGDGKHTFIVDINRKGNINFTKKCTYQGGYQKDTPLLRLDIDAAEHTNPDGENVTGNHMHIYREGYGDRFAISIPSEIVNPEDLFQTLIDFLAYFKTINAKLLEIETVI